MWIIRKNYSVVHIKMAMVDGDALSSEEDQQMCKNFKMTSADVIDYFKHARRIPFGLYNYHIETGCYAVGSVVFKNGDQGTWTIDRNRLGTLFLSDGRWACFYALNAHSKAFPFKGNPNFWKPEADSIPRTTRSFALPKVKTIVFRKDFRWEMTEQQQAGGCRFSLSEDDVRDFFNCSKKITNEERLKIIYGKSKVRRLIPLTGCQVEGDVEFVNGEKGIWVIYDNRIGTIEIDRITFHLYAKAAQAKSFRKP